MTPPAAQPVLRLGATTFVSAFLLFQVQPLLAKAVLPWFGGSPAVWTTCMLFFQVLLLGGYAVATVCERIAPRPRLLLLLFLLAAALLCLPLSPAVDSRGASSEQPVLALLRILLLSVGAPYLILATTGPLAQAWFRRAAPHKSPYRLYALSNAGSLMSLLSYPVAIEPWLPLRWQSRLWSIGFVIYVILYGASAVRDYGLRHAAAEDAAQTGAEAPLPRLHQRLLWIGLPALSSLALLATTNHVCQNVAVIPFLWVLPLSLYLLTFIIAFDHERRYLRGLCGAAGVGLVLLSASGSGLSETGEHLAYLRELVKHLGALFFVCMLCHGEVVRHRPHPRYLTGFYLCLSLGGAVGGLFVSLLAPRMFHSFFEWRMTLVGGYSLAAVVLASSLWRRLERLAWLRVPLLGVLSVGLIPIVRAPIEESYGTLLSATRNFYGVLRVFARAEDDPEMHDRVLFHGAIIHGVQFQNGARRLRPNTYYWERTGVGMALTYLSSTTPDLQVGVIGLGTGTLASYARPGHRFRFFEINPAVEDVARRYFGYLGSAKGQVEVVLGDARISLMREPATQPRYHLLVLDAFSGDAIPAHLLTREAMEIYRSRLRPDGALAIHISNRYLDLAPVVRGLARSAGMEAMEVTNKKGPKDEERYSSDWMLLARERSQLTLMDIVGDGKLSNGRELLWTDESNDLFRVLR